MGVELSEDLQMVVEEFDDLRIGAVRLEGLWCEKWHRLWDERSEDLWDERSEDLWEE